MDCTPFARIGSNVTLPTWEIAEEMKIEAKRVHVLKAHVKTDMILLSVSLRSLECNHLASLASGKAEVICNMQLTCKVDLQGQFFQSS